METKEVRELILRIDEEFHVFERPKIIYPENNSRNPSNEELLIQKDFQDLDRKNMTYQQASMMIIDHTLICDQAVLYFLPTLAKAALEQDGDTFMFGRRLEELNLNKLSEKQVLLISQLIKAAEELEEAIEED